MKLRFNLMELAREIAQHIMNTYNSISFEERQPNMWVSTNCDEFNSYKGGASHTPITYQGHLYGIRIFETAKGITLFYDSERWDNRPLNWSLKTLKAIKDGKSLVNYRKKEMLLQLHLKHNGTVSWKSTSKGNRHLAVSSHINLPYLSTEIRAKLLTIRCNQEWFEPLIKGAYGSTEPIRLSMDIIRSCSNLQAFLNKINLSGYPVSAKKFKNVSLEHLMVIMELANSCANPEQIFEFPEMFINKVLSDAEMRGMTMDYHRMAQKLGQQPRATMNPKKLRELHDEVMLEELKNMDMSNSRKLVIDETYRKFYKKLDPTVWELLDQTNRLKMEGLMQKHCVGGYESTIDIGECMILSTVFQHRRYTADIRKDWSDKRLYINQFRGYSNCGAPAYLWNQLATEIDLFNATELNVHKPQWKHEVNHTPVHEANLMGVEHPW